MLRQTPLLLTVLALSGCTEEALESPLREVGRAEVANAYDLFVHEDTILAAGFTESLAVLDAAPPFERGLELPLTWANEIALLSDGATLLAADGPSGLLAGPLDGSQPLAVVFPELNVPSHLATFDEGLFYVADNRDIVIGRYRDATFTRLGQLRMRAPGLQIWPSQLVHHDGLLVLGAAFAQVSVNGEVTDWEAPEGTTTTHIEDAQPFMVFDVSDPSAPVWLASLAPGEVLGMPVDFAWSLSDPSLLYVLESAGMDDVNAGVAAGFLQTLDMADPTHPVVVASDTWQRGVPFALEILDNCLLVGTQRGEIRFHDLTDPRMPTHTETAETGSEVHDIVRLGDHRVAIANWREGVRVFDL